MRTAVIVACGSFSPPTYMHLQLFFAAKDYLKQRYERVLGVCSPVHDAYQKKDLLPSHHRVRLCQSLFEQYSWIKVDKFETEQGDFTRTALVLPQLRHNVMKRMREEGEDIKDDDVDCCLLCGTDLFNSFFIPEVWTEEDVISIQNDFGVLIIEREGEVAKIDFAKENNPTAKLFGPVQPVTKNNLSSSLIRKLLRAGKSTRHLLSAEVEKYCLQHQFWDGIMPVTRRGDIFSSPPAESEREGEREQTVSDASHQHGDAPILVLLASLSRYTLTHARVVEELVEDFVTNTRQKPHIVCISLTHMESRQKVKKELEKEYENVIHSIQVDNMEAANDMISTEWQRVAKVVVPSSDVKDVVEMESFARVMRSMREGGVTKIGVSNVGGKCEHLHALREVCGDKLDVEELESEVLLSIPASMVLKREEEGKETGFLLPYPLSTSP